MATLDDDLGIIQLEDTNLQKEKDSLGIIDLPEKNSAVENRSVFIEESNQVVDYSGNMDDDEIEYDVRKNHYAEEEDGFIGAVKVGVGMAANFVKGAGSFALEGVPRAAIGLASEQSQEPYRLDVTDFVGAVLGNPMDQQELMNSFNPAQRQRNEAVADQLKASYLRLDNSVKTWAQGAGIKPDEGLGNKVAFDLGSGTASLLTALGLAYVSKGKSLSGTAKAAIMFGGLAKGQRFTESQEAGMSFMESQAISSASGIAEGGLEYLGLEVWTKYLRGSKTISRVLLRGADEFIQEASQEFSGATIAKLSGLEQTEWSDIFKQAGYAGLLGLAIGVPVASFQTAAENKGWVGRLRKAGLNDAEIEEVGKRIQDKVTADATPEIKKTLDQEAQKFESTEVIPEEIRLEVSEAAKEQNMAREQELQAQEAQVNQEVDEDTSFDFGENVNLTEDEGLKVANELREELMRISELPETIQQAMRIEELSNIIEALSMRREAARDVRDSGKYGRIRRYLDGNLKEELDEIPSFFMTNSETAITLDQFASDRGMTESEAIAFLKSMKITRADIQKAASAREELAQIVRENKAKNPQIKAAIEKHSPSSKRFTPARMLVSQQALLKRLFQGAFRARQQGAIEQKQDTAFVQQEVVNFIQNSDMVPKDKAKFLSAIKNVQTPEQLIMFIPTLIERTNKLIEKENVKQLKTKIKEEIKSTKAKKQSGKPVGKFTPEVQEVLDQFRLAMKLNSADAAARIQANLAKYQGAAPPTEVVMENRILSMAAGMDTMGSQELGELLQAIQSVKESGKMLRELADDERKEMLDDAKSKFISELTGGKGINEAARTVGIQDAEEGKLGVRQSIGKLIDGMVYAWDDLLDILSGKSGSRSGESFISRFGNVNRETLKERGGRRVANEKLSALVQSAYGVDAKGVAKVLVQNTEMIDLGEFTNVAGKTEKIVASKDQLIKKWMEMQDPTLAETFVNEGGMAWTPDIIEAVNEALTEQDKAFGQAQLDFYRAYYEGVNEVYEKIYGVKLPFNELYSPIRREGDSISGLDSWGEFMQEAQTRLSVTNGSLKDRVKNIRPLKWTQATSALEQHVDEMERFKAWAVKLRDLNAVLTDSKVKQAIVENYGARYHSELMDALQTFARGGAHREQIRREVDAFRISFTQSVMAFRPVNGMKQTSSIFAFLEEISTIDLVSGMIDFAKDIKGNLAILHENEFFKSRGNNQERDMKDAINSDPFAKFREKPGFRNQIMWNISAGDLVTVNLGGWAVYKQGLKKGLSKEAALTRAAEVANRTQQSSDLSQQNAWQRGDSWAKLATMFLSNPNQQLRRYMWALRGLRTGRMEPEKAAKMILIYQFIIPMVVQMMSDMGFKKERQLRAAVMGPFNGLFIIGDVTEWTLGLLTGGSRHPLDAAPAVVSGYGRDIKKLLTTIDWNDIQAEDVWEAFQGALGLVGKVPGSPASGLPLAETSEMLEGLHELVFQQNAKKGFAGLIGIGEGTRKDFGEGSGGRPKVQL